MGHLSLLGEPGGGVPLLEAVKVTKGSTKVALKLSLQ